MKRKHLFLALFLCLIHMMAFAQADIPIQIGFDEKQGEYIDLDVSLINEQGERVLMRDLLGMPTILNLVYFQCPGSSAGL